MFSRRATMEEQRFDDALEVAIHGSAPAATGEIAAARFLATGLAALRAVPPEARGRAWPSVQARIAQAQHQSSRQSLWRSRWSAGALVLLIALVAIGVALARQRLWVLVAGPGPVHIAEYRLETGFPEGLPEQAPVYRVIEGTIPAAEWGRRVASALGFTGDPVSESRGAAQPEWTWVGQERGLLTVDGNIAYQCSSPPAGAAVAGAPKDAEQAIGMAREWLTARDLLPADCADDVQAWPGVGGLGWEMGFRRRLDGLPVGSYWSWAGGLQLRLNSLGEVGFMTYLRHEVAKGTAVRLRPVEQAWQELEEYGPAFFDCEGPPTGPTYQTYTVTRVEIGYRECCHAGMEVQEELRPYYVFSGEAEIANWDRKIRATAYMPAWK